MYVNLRNQYTGEYITAKIGFSWTTFFFGAWAPLFRGDFFWFFILILIGFASFGTLSRLIFCWIYNGIYLRKKLTSGFVAADALSQQILLEKGYIF